MKLTPDQLKLTPEELAKDIQLRAAEALAREIDPDVDFVWVKKGSVAPSAAAVRGRRHIVFNG